jgi:hypothetical protein
MLKKSEIKDFSILSIDFNSKMLIFLGKNKWLKKKPKWRPKTKMALGRFFLNRNSTETPSSGSLRNVFVPQIF